MIWDWSAESITAIGTVALAAIALVVAVLEGRAMRKHNQLSVQPILIIDINQKPMENGIFSISFDLRNAGIGPAIIKDIDLHVSEAKDSAKDEVLMKKFKKQPPPSFNYRGALGLEPNIKVIEAGKSAHIVSLVSPIVATKQYVQDMLDFARYIVIKIEYQSIHQNETFTCVIDYSQLKSAPHKSPKELDA